MQIISDQGSNFMSQLVQSLCEMFNVKRHRTTAFHPMANGRVEVMNSSIGKCLRAYCMNNQENWHKNLPAVLMALRMTPNSTTKCSPYQLLFGTTMRHPIDHVLIPKDFISKTAKGHLADIQKSLNITHEIAKQNCEDRQTQQKTTYDKQAEVPKYMLGDTVLLQNNNKELGKSKKLSPKYKDPYRIELVGPPYTYQLRDLQTDKVLPGLVNANRLKPYHDRLLLSSDKREAQVPIPVMEKLIGTRVRNGSREYRIKWLNDTTSSWEPADIVSDLLIKQYLRTHTKSGKRRKKVARAYKYFKTG